MTIKNTIPRFIPLLLVVSALVGCGPTENNEALSAAPETSERPPNIIIFYADDLGYADLSSYGAVGVETPAVDALVARGVKFTDAHAAAATCTPSRYALLTGEYGFRSQAEILPGDAPALIRPGQPTIASFLRDQGYVTGVVGKWHLGLGDGEVDWNTTISPGPSEIGFNYSFLMPATGDRVPTVYVEDQRVVDLSPDDPITVDYRSPVGERPIGRERPDLLKMGADDQHSDTIINGISRIGYMQGGVSAEWVDEDFPFVFTDKAIAFIRENQDQPFLLYRPFHDIHVPRAPNRQFVGASSMGPRGDAIAQMDWMVGQVVDEIKRLGLAKDTIVIFTSDNGPVLDDGYADQAVELLGEHKPGGPFRGGKYSAYEAGARVPMVVVWEGRTENGVSDALISQVDFFASIAALINEDLDPDVAIDSLDLSRALLGETDGREWLFKESVGTVSLRWNDWKFIDPVGPEVQVPAWLPPKGIEGGLSQEPQLFDLSLDIGEIRSVAADHEQVVAVMEEKLGVIRGKKTSTGRVPQK